MKIKPVKRLLFNGENKSLVNVKILVWQKKSTKLA